MDSFVLYNYERKEGFSCVFLFCLLFFFFFTISEVECCCYTDTGPRLFIETQALSLDGWMDGLVTHGETRTRTCMCMKGGMKDGCILLFCGNSGV